MNAAEVVWRRAILVAVLAMVGGGCATVHRCTVEAVCNRDVSVSGFAFCVESGNPSLNREDLRFREATQYVSTALSAHGFYEVVRREDATIVVEIDFGREGPIPRAVRRPAPPVAVALPPAGGGPGGMQPPSGEDETAELPPPPPPVIIHRVQQEIVDDYEKFLRITARETPAAAGDRTPRQVWSVVVSITDPEEDVRTYLPLLAAAAMDAVGRDSGRPVEIVLGENDARVAFIKRGL